MSPSRASVTLHLAPSARGSDLVQADPRWARRSGPMALGVEQARHTHPPSARARPLNGRQEHQEDSSWLHSSGLRPASAGGAGCPGCGRVLQPPGPVTAPQNCPSAAYSTASQPLPPPQGLYYRPYCAASYWQPGGRAPRAPRRAHGSQSSNEYCRPAASRLPGGSTRLARRAPAALAAAGGRCAGRCCAGWRAVRPPAAAAPAPSLAGAVAPRAPNSAGTRHASSLSRGEQAVQRAKRARSRTFKAGSGHSKGIPLRIPSVPPS